MVAKAGAIRRRPVQVIEEAADRGFVRDGGCAMGADVLLDEEARAVGRTTLKIRLRRSSSRTLDRTVDDGLGCERAAREQEAKDPLRGKRRRWSGCLLLRVRRSADHGDQGGPAAASGAGVV
jgi:hypothetical protein